MAREAGIFVDGRSVGDVDIEVLEDGAFGEPPPASYSTTPLDKIPGMGLPGDRQPTFRGIGHGVGGQGIGPGARAHAAAHKLPVFRGRGVAGKHKHIQPHYTKPDGTRAPPPYKGGPIFRPHIQPRGAAPPAKPEHITLEDIHGTVRGDKTKIRGDTDRAIVEAARRHGLSPNTMRAIASIESSNNPESNRNKATQYKGLFQMGRAEWAKYGHGDIYNARDNAEAASHMLADHKAWFRGNYGRDPSDAELYMMHQQGHGFYSAGTMTNIGGNPYPGMHGPQTHESFEAGWGRELARRKGQFEPEAGGGVIGTTRLGADPNYHPAVAGTHAPGAPITGPLGDLPAAPGYHPELSSVDPRLREILSASAAKFERDHPGYHLAATSGHRGGAGQAAHGSATGAVDVQIIGPNGPISNRGEDPTHLYHEYARRAYGEMLTRHPELKGKFAWGGAFGTQVPTGGPPDLMHFDISGERGHWTESRPSVMGPWEGTEAQRAGPEMPSAAERFGQRHGRGDEPTFATFERRDPRAVAQDEAWSDYIESERKINVLGTHADWPKFEHEARPSTNIEDVRRPELIKQYSDQSQRYRPMPAPNFGGERFGIEAADVPWSRRTTPEQLRAIRTERFATELANPRTRNLLFASAMAEVGNQGAAAQRAYMESVFNRAAARNETIAQTVSNTHYYPTSTIKKLGRQITGADQLRLMGIMGEVMLGSNISKMATGNASGNVGFGEGGIPTVGGRTPPTPSVPSSPQHPPQVSHPSRPTPHPLHPSHPQHPSHRRHHRR